MSGGGRDGEENSGDLLISNTEKAKPPDTLNVDIMSSGEEDSRCIHADMPPLPSERHKPGSLKRLLEKEGHDARNVVSWLVPNSTGGGGGEGKGGGGEGGRGG